MMHAAATAARLGTGRSWDTGLLWRTLPPASLAGPLVLLLFGASPAVALAAPADEEQSAEPDADEAESDPAAEAEGSDDEGAGDDDAEPDLVPDAAPARRSPATVKPGPAAPGSGRTRRAPIDPFAPTRAGSLFKLEEEVVAVATGYDQRVKEAPSIVQVLPARRLRELGVTKLSEALELIPGVHLTMGSAGQEFAFFRGTLADKNNKLLLLVDGVPWNDPLYHHAPIDEYLPLERVARLEVIRGPGSARYGTDAFAGVINVVTVQGEGVRGLRLVARGGSFARRGVHLVGGDSFATPLGDAQVAAYVRYLTQDGDGPTRSLRGYPRVLANDPKTGFAAGLRFDLEQLTLALDTIDYRRLRLSDAQDDFTGVVLSDIDLFNYHNQDHFLSASYDWQLGHGLRLQPRAWAQGFDDPGTYGTPATVRTVTDEQGNPRLEQVDGFLTSAQKRSRRYGAALELSHQLGEVNRLAIGGEWTLERFLLVEDISYPSGSHTASDQSAFRIWNPPQSIYDLAAFVQDTFNPHPMVGLTVGGRFDHHKYFGSQLSPRAGLVLNPLAWLTTKVLWGQAFRAPVARELLVRPTPGYLGSWTEGNTTLSPERIQTIEGELTLRPLEPLSLTVGGYYNQIRDEIAEVAFVTEDGTAGARYQNLTRGTTVGGLEAELRWATDPVEAFVDYSMTLAKDEATGLKQYGIPRHTVNGALTLRALRPVALSLVGRYVGSQPRRAWAPQTKAPDGEPYLLLDAHVLAEEILRKRMRIGCSVRNLLDVSYDWLRAKAEADRCVRGDCAANGAYYVEDIAGPGRRFEVFIEGSF